jgi:hypothetical protein
VARGQTDRPAGRYGSTQRAAKDTECPAAKGQMCAAQQSEERCFTGAESQASVQWPRRTSYPKKQLHFFFCGSLRARQNPRPLQPSGQSSYKNNGMSR